MFVVNGVFALPVGVGRWVVANSVMFGNFVICVFLFSCVCWRCGLLYCSSRCVSRIQLRGWTHVGVFVSEVWGLWSDEWQLGCVS